MKAKKQKKPTPRTFTAWFKDQCEGNPLMKDNLFLKLQLKQAFLAGQLTEAAIVSDIFKLDDLEQ